jgi:molybdenum cofactor cytidylyltransferase
MAQNNLAAVVLASGFSRRLGANKLLLPLDEETTVIEKVLDRVNELACVAVAVVSQYAEVLSLAAVRGFTAVTNHRAQEGKSSSIRLGLAALETMAAKGEIPLPEGVIFFPGDQPLLTKEALISLKTAFQEQPDKIIFPTYDGRPGAPAIFPMNMAPRLKRLQGEEGGMKAALEQGERILYLPAGPVWQGWDLDTPDDWEKIKLFYCNLAGEHVK